MSRAMMVTVLYHLEGEPASLPYYAKTHSLL